MDYPGQYHLNEALPRWAKLEDWQQMTLCMDLLYNLGVKCDAAHVEGFAELLDQLQALEDEDPMLVDGQRR
jgi:hypothetical protein